MISLEVYEQFNLLALFDYDLLCYCSHSFKSFPITYFCVLLFFSFFFLLQIDEWLEYAPALSVGSAFENVCKYVDDYLTGRTFLVAHYLSIADIAIWSGLAGKGL